MSSSLPFADLFQVPWGEYVGNLGIGLLRTLGFHGSRFERCTPARAQKVEMNWIRSGAPARC
jgi:hypothetical protein